MSLKLWLRDEDKTGEKRSPLTPENAKKLIDYGVDVTVQSSSTRIFTNQEYLNAGCKVTDKPWQEASLDFYVLGLKELNVNDQTSFPHQHIYFAHSYKGQALAQKTLDSFKRGSGTLYDLEYLVDDQGKRIAAFGVWAGFVGMALAIDYYFHKQGSNKPYPSLTHFPNKESLIDSIKQKRTQGSSNPSIIILGSLGRCGQGAKNAAELCKLEVTGWDYEETKKGGPFLEINEYDILINCALINKKIPPFVTIESLTSQNKQISIISDVGCDPQSDLNPLPIYQDNTSWAQPFTYLSDIDVNLISIDNLPSILPLESSIDFSNQLLPYLINLHDEGPSATVWNNALKTFQKHL